MNNIPCVLFSLAQKVENTQNSLILCDDPCTDSYECGFGPRISGDYDGSIVLHKVNLAIMRPFENIHSSVAIKNVLKTFPFIV